MKANKWILPILIPCLLLSFGCTRCNTVRPEPPAPVTFYIVDQQNNSLFASTPSGYHPDSLRFTLENEPYTYFFTSTDEALNNFVFETYPVMYNKPRVRLLLHYGREITDTLEISYTVSKSPCLTSYTYTSFRYNGTELQRHPETGHLKLTLQQHPLQHSELL